MLRLLLSVLFLLPAILRAAEADSIVSPVNRLDFTSLSWKELTAQFARDPDGKATFEEVRHFGFSSKPTVVKGEAFVSMTRGLSLHYLEPEERTVIMDSKGMLVRDKGGDAATPPSPATAPVLHILHLDLDALQADFEVYGVKDEKTWKLELVPKSKAMIQAYSSIRVSGEGTRVGRIVLQHSARNSVEILLTRTGAPTPEEMKRFFR